MNKKIIFTFPLAVSCLTLFGCKKNDIKVSKIYASVPSTNIYKRGGTISKADFSVYAELSGGGQKEIKSNEWSSIKFGSNDTYTFTTSGENVIDIKYGEHSTDVKISVSPKGSTDFTFKDIEPEKPLKIEPDKEKTLEITMKESGAEADVSKVEWSINTSLGEQDVIEITPDKTNQYKCVVKGKKAGNATIDVKVTDTIGGSKTNSLLIDVKSSIVPVDFYTCSWSDIATRCNNLEDGSYTDDEFVQSFTFGNTPATSLDDFVGKERTVKVNNQDHKVRVIGTKHDKDTNNNTLALTFEFANLISDSNGYSLAYQWNDSSTYYGLNFDYPNTSIRKVLCGSGNFASNVYCATKTSISETKPTWDSNYTYTSTNNKTILSMLPTDLSNVLKSTKKSVNTVKVEESTKTVQETEYNDKLFILSAREYGLPNSGESQEDRYQEIDCGTAYKYYENPSSLQIDTKRIKKQVNLNEALTNKVTISGDASALTQYKEDIAVFAGYNSAAENEGGYYWTRSIDIKSSTEIWSGTWRCGKDGGLYRGGSGDYARAVAPAFCI